MACAQPQASLEMALAIRMKAKILHDIAAQQLLGIHINIIEDSIDVITKLCREMKNLPN